jgi:hypothetical protein
MAAVKGRMATTKGGVPATKAGMSAAKPGVSTAHTAVSPLTRYRGRSGCKRGREAGCAYRSKFGHDHFS